MKTLRFIGIFTVIFALVACSCVSVAAEETDYIPQQIEFIVDSARTIMGYDGSDEAYNSYIESTGAASSVGLMIETLNRIGNVGDFFAGTPIDKISISYDTPKLAVKDFFPKCYIITNKVNRRASEEITYISYSV